MRRRVEGYVEGPIDVEDTPHRYVWFPSVSLTGAQFVRVPEEVLAELGVDLSPGVQSIIAADVNLDAVAPGFVNPINIESLGTLQSLDAPFTLGR
jgi:hypothetical protein